MKGKYLPENVERGERLRKARSSLHLSRKPFGYKCGVNEAAIKNKESGLVEIEIIFAEKVQKEFGINSHWLLTGEGKMFTAPSDAPITLQDTIAGEPDTLDVHEGKAEYGKINELSYEDYKLMKRAERVLCSSTIFAGALRQNLQAFLYGLDLHEEKEAHKKKDCDTPGEECPGAAEGAAKVSG